MKLNSAPSADRLVVKPLAGAVMLVPLAWGRARWMVTGTRTRGSASCPSSPVAGTINDPSGATTLLVGASTFGGCGPSFCTWAGRVAGVTRCEASGSLRAMTFSPRSPRHHTTVTVAVARTTSRRQRTLPDRGGLGLMRNGNCARTTGSFGQFSAG